MLQSKLGFFTGSFNSPDFIGCGKTAVLIQYFNYFESSSQKAFEDLISSCLISLFGAGSNASISEVQDSSPNGLNDLFTE